MQQYAHAFFPAEVWLTHNNVVHMKCKRNHNCRITILQLKRFLVITVTLSYCVSSFSGGFGNFSLLMKYLSLSTYWRYYFEKKNVCETFLLLIFPACSWLRRTVLCSVWREAVRGWCTLQDTRWSKRLLLISWIALLIDQFFLSSILSIRVLVSIGASRSRNCQTYPLPPAPPSVISLSLWQKGLMM